MERIEHGPFGPQNDKSRASRAIQRPALKPRRAKKFFRIAVQHRGAVAENARMRSPRAVPFRNFASTWLKQIQRTEAKAADRHATLLSTILLPVLGEISLDKIDVAAVEQLHAATRHIPSTGNEAFALLRLLLDHAEDTGARPRGSNPVLSVRPHTVPLADAAALQRQAVLGTCEEVLDGTSSLVHENVAAIFWLVVHLGARSGDIRRLHWRNFDPGQGDHGAFWVQDSGSSFSERVILLDARARELVDRHGAQQRGLDTPIFPSHRTGRPYVNLDLGWHRVRAAAGHTDLALRSFVRTAHAPQSTSSQGPNAGSSTSASPDGVDPANHLQLAQLRHGPRVLFSVFATAWLQEREDEYNCGELARATYLSYRRSVVGILIPALGKTPVCDINVPMLRAIRRQTIEIPARGNQALGLARRILNEAEALQLRPPHSNPAARVKRHSELASARPATPEQVNIVTDACEAILASKPSNSKIAHYRRQAATIFLLIARTGARPSEIIRLRWSYIELTSTGGCLRLPEHKTKGKIGEKTIVLSPKALAVFRSLWEEASARDGWVFPSYLNPSQPYRDLARGWRSFADALGFPNLKLRDLRSGVATNAYRHGVTLEKIQTMLGHRRLETTRRYTRIAPSQIAQQYAVLEAGLRHDRQQHGGHTDA